MRILSFIGMMILGFFAIEAYIHYRVKSGVKTELNKELMRVQNEAIAKKEVDTKTYIKEIPKAQEKIITKYKNIITKDNTCESKLEEIQNAMDLYFHSTYSH